ncbi:TonB-dependent receptor [Sphingomonas sp. G-3-2-10]|uniref:TonB-dependent receptor n=1 Tax=Sphingomonas sp. G-3-2-10 TaxID=2728838 RepID=UPI00146F41CD|nr:TonB-dependent receptor [Sphingomonas sp. G-3-2-10]NML04362.1 TonB-dependent receptor [Sphingomonas sp. G-3-2-10]
MINRSQIRAVLQGTACTMAVLAFHAAPAFAQDAEEARDDDGKLTEIVVTAERRNQNLQDVPISATVLTGDDLGQKGITNLNDIQQVAPSVAINTYNRSTYINIRGVGIAQSAPTSNPGVAYYIDGQSITHEFFIGQSFYDIGSIEVLRGPQGTLTGQNSTGGAVFVRTPEPRFDQFGGVVDASYGDYNLIRVMGAANLPFSDNFAMRIAAITETRDSFTTNAGPSVSQPGNLDLFAIRGNLAFRSSDDRLKLNVRAEYFVNDTDNNAIKNRNDYTLNVRTGTNPFLISEDAISRQRIEGYRVNAEVRADITDGIRLRAISSWQDAYVADQADGDRTSVSPPNAATTNNAGNGVGRATSNRSDFRTWTHEVNILSSGEGSLNWVVGGFLMDETIPVRLQRDQTNTVVYQTPANTSITHADNNTKSLFGQVNWFATPELELIAGARHSWDKQVYDRIRIGAGQGVTTGPTVGTTSQSSREWTGKLGINYHLSDDTMLYVTASKGYKAGGNNLALVTGAPAVPVPGFLPEKNFVYEVGFKTEILDRHLRINGDVFYSDYKDIQLQSLQNGAPLTQNAASGRAYGGELEITGQFGGLSFNGGLSYLNAEFASNAMIQNTVTNALQAITKGDRLPFSPEWTINAGVQYEIPLGGDLSLTPRVQWSHLGEQLATPFPSISSIVPGRDIFDVRLSLNINDRYRLEGYVSNVTDKVYIASQVQNSSSAAGGIIFGAPRQFGVRFVAKFGGE